MSDDQPWNDEARSDLRSRLRETILGELRLAKNQGLMQPARSEI